MEVHGALQRTTEAPWRSKENDCWTTKKRMELDMGANESMWGVKAEEKEGVGGNWSSRDS